MGIVTALGRPKVAGKKLAQFVEIVGNSSGNGVVIYPHITAFDHLPQRSFYFAKASSSCFHTLGNSQHATPTFCRFDQFD